MDRSASTTYVAFLRGINVGGHKQVSMSDLKSLLARLGFQDESSLLQSGNLVFRGERSSTGELERRLEAETGRRLGLSTDYFVRTARELREVVSHNPFPKQAKDDPGHLLVQFLKEAPAAGRLRSLQAAIVGRELVRARDREAYVFYPDGVGGSRLTTALLDRELGTRATGRNWNTVLKIAALVGKAG